MKRRHARSLALTSSKSWLAVWSVVVSIGLMFWGSIELYAQGERAREKLNRGVVAVAQEGGGVMVSWRSLADDPKDVAFNVYRERGKDEPVRVNGAPIDGATCLLDEGAARADVHYFVRSIIDGREGKPSRSVSIWLLISARAFCRATTCFLRLSSSARQRSRRFSDVCQR